MSEQQAELLKQAIAAQDHYPCTCHDWVWRVDHWELAARMAAPPVRPDWSEQ